MGGKQLLRGFDMSCDHCREAIYGDLRQMKQIGKNSDLQSFLLQCKLCNAYFEYSPMVNEIPEVTIEHVTQFYPNALIK